MKTTLFVTKNFCDCRLCRGSRLIQTENDRYAHVLARDKGWTQYITGGRYPEMYTYNPADLCRIEWTANGNPSNWDGPHPSEPWNWPEVYRAEDSVQGCTKIHRRQEVSFHLRPECEYSIDLVFTREEN